MPSLPILPLPCVVASLTLDVEERVHSAVVSKLGPSSCPSNLLFVPENLRAEMLEWGHTSQFTCHPRVRRRYVRTCGPCSQQSPLVRVWQAFSSLCQFLVSRGPTSPRTLQACPAQRGTLSYSPSLIDSVRWLTLFPSRNFPRPRR